AADAGSRQLRIVRVVLATMRARDEGALEEAAAVHRPGEDDVARLVADEERADHPRLAAAQVDDADAVREMVHDPDLGVRARRDGDRLEADRDGGAVRQVAGRRVDGEYLEAVVGTVDRKQRRAVRRQRQGPDLAALELDERRGVSDARDRGDGEQAGKK